MDQGFSAQGFSRNDAATIERGVATHLPMHVHAPKPTTAQTAAKGAVSEANRGIAAPKLSAQEKQVAGLDGIKSGFMMPANLEFFGMMGGGALGWVTNKFGWQRATAAVGMVFKAPVQALRDTSLSKTFHLPANLLKAASGEAASAGVKTQSWAANTANYAEGFTAHANTLDAELAKFAAPARNAGSVAIGHFEVTGVGKGLHGLFDRMVNWRSAAVAAKHESAFVKAQAALTTQASSGMMETVSGFFSGLFGVNKAATIPAGELSHIVDGLHAAKGNPGALKQIATQLETMVAGGVVSADVKARAGAVMKHVQSLASSAHAMETYGAASGGSMKTMAKALVSTIGRVPLFHALLAVGVTAGVAGAVVSANMQSKQARQAFADLSGQLETSNSGFLQAVKNAQKSNGFTGTAKAGLKVVDEVANGAMWMMPGGGGVALMGAMVVPQICQSLVPDNALLGAFVALQKNERGELALAPDGKIEAIRNLVAAMPAVAAKGGFYNRLAQPIAAELVSRNFNTQQIVQLLGNEAAFTKLASEVAAKRAEQAKAPAVVANDHAGVAPADKVEGPAHPAAVKAEAAMTEAEGKYLGAEKPSYKLAANDVSVEGKVVAQQRHMA